MQSRLSARPLGVNAEKKLAYRIDRPLWHEKDQRGNEYEPKHYQEKPSLSETSAFSLSQNIRLRNRRRSCRIE